MKYKTIEESIISAMDMTDIGIIKYLPYILQDFWEIGSSSEEVIKIIKKYKTNYSNLSVLDLASGKGAVSIKIAAQLKCNCFGIDAIDDFVIFSNNESKKYSVNNICVFETNDIRTRIKTLGKYDVILLAATGPIFESYYNAFMELVPHLNNDGLIIIDADYVEDGCGKNHPNFLSKSELFGQLNNAGMEVIDKITNDDIPEINEEYEIQFENLSKRCLELIDKYPQDKNLFLEYVEEQKKEYEILSNVVKLATLIIKQKRFEPV